jgi:hypothetical protein
MVSWLFFLFVAVKIRQIQKKVVLVINKSVKSRKKLYWLSVIRGNNSTLSKQIYLNPYINPKPNKTVTVGFAFANGGLHFYFRLVGMSINMSIRATSIGKTTVAINIPQKGRRAFRDSIIHAPMTVATGTPYVTRELKCPVYLDRSQAKLKNKITPSIAFNRANPSIFVHFITITFTSCLNYNQSDRSGTCPR